MHCDAATIQQREAAVSLWFQMWLKQQNLGIQELFSSDATYIESWGPRYEGAEQIQHWFCEWNTRGRVLNWDIRQMLHDVGSTAVLWYFRCRMKDGVEQRFEGMSLVRWSAEGKIVFLQEFGCNLNQYNPYQNQAQPQWKEQPVLWF